MNGAQPEQLNGEQPKLHLLAGHRLRSQPQQANASNQAENAHAERPAVATIELAIADSPKVYDNEANMYGNEDYCINESRNFARLVQRHQGKEGIRGHENYY